MKKFNTINVIPFVDILLVLLAIVLMCSSFIAKGAIPISLPKASASNHMPQKSVELTLTANGILFWDKKEIEREVLFREIDGISKESPIAIHCDKEVPFHFFVTLLDGLKHREFNHIEIVTEK